MSLEYKKLGDVAKFIRGITYKPNDLVENFSENSTVCMRTANVQSKLKEDDLLSVPLSFVKNTEKFLIEGDLLVSTANSWNLVGKCCWIPKLDYSATAGGFISILRANDELLDKRYLYHWFNSSKTQQLARSFGRQTTNISNMDLGRCLDIKIPLPLLPEQRRIASILDKVGELRQKRQQAIENLDQLLQATFIDMFGDPVSNPKGWELFKLSDLGHIATGNTPSREQTENYGNYIEWIKSDNLNNEEDFATTSTEYLSEIGSKKARIVPKGSILVTCIAGSFNCIGNLAIVDRQVAFNQQINSITPNDKTVLEFLYYLMKISKPIIQSASTNSMKGMINKSKFSDVKLPVPPKDKQVQFVDLFNKITRLKELNNLYCDQSENLFKSLQNQAFNGTL